MWPRLLLIIVCSISAFAIPRPDTKEQLKALAHLPKIEFGSPLTFSVEAGFVAFPDPGVVQEKLSELRKENKKDGAQGLLFLKMARLQEQVNNRGEALALYYRASELLRKKIEMEPENFPALCGLGETLTALGKFSEAEHHIEKALALDSKKAAGWAALANLEKIRAYRALVTDELFYANSSFLELLSDLLRQKSDTQQIEQTQKYLRRASAHFDKTIELEPAKAEWRIRRAAFTGLKAALERAIFILRGGEAGPRDFNDTIFNEDAFRDLLAASDLGPDPELLAACSIFPLLSTSVRGSASGPRLFKDKMWDFLSEDTRMRLRSDMSALTRLAESSEIRVAATAFEALGSIQYLALQDGSASESSFRQAIAVNPKQERSWDMLMLLLSNRGRVSELLDLCENRAEANPSPRNLVLFAKAAEKGGDLAKAEGAVMLALGANQNDFLANLAMANVLLKRTDADQFLDRIQDALTKADRNLGAHPTYQNMFDLAFTKSIYYAVNDEPDRARRMLKEWLPRARENSEITEALLVLGY
jgi:tetratricopeptide (TPR) repeat protein